MSFGVRGRSSAYHDRSVRVSVACLLMGTLVAGIFVEGSPLMGNVDPLVKLVDFVGGRRDGHVGLRGAIRGRLARCFFLQLLHHELHDGSNDVRVDGTLNSVRIHQGLDVVVN